MAGRRFLLLLALLLGLTAVAASVAPNDRPGSTERADPPGDPEATASQTRTETLSAADDPQRLVIERGELIALEVSADERDAVSIPGLGLMDAVDPQSPARFTIFADRPGVYPVELLAADRRVGTLEVED